jgi:hypothetical protein
MQSVGWFLTLWSGLNSSQQHHFVSLRIPRPGGCGRPVKTPRPNVASLIAHWYWPVHQFVFRVSSSLPICQHVVATVRVNARRSEEAIGKSYRDVCHCDWRTGEGLSVCPEINLSSFRLTSPALKDRSTLILSLRDVHDRLPRQGLLRVARYFSAGARAKRAVSRLFADRRICNHYFVTGPKWSISQMRSRIHGNDPCFGSAGLRAGIRLAPSRVGGTASPPVAVFLLGNPGFKASTDAVHPAPRDSPHPTKPGKIRHCICETQH